MALNRSSEFKGVNFHIEGAVKFGLSLHGL